MKYISNIAHLNATEQACIHQRLKVIKFFEQYGPVATKAAFGTGRSTIYLWRQKIHSSGGYLSSLKAESKAPKTRTKRKRNFQIDDFVLAYRKEHQGVDKVTVKSALDASCLALGIATVSESTVGRIIEELKAKGKLPDYYIRTTINGKTGRLRYKSTGKKPSKARVGSYKPKEAGDLVQIDAITIFLAGIKRYIICAIDIKTRFAFAYSYKTLSSATAKDFMSKLQEVAPFTIRQVQTDNGSEFHGHFDACLKAQGITHYWNYPKSPKMNTYVERFNGVIQRQHIGWHIDELYEPKLFNQGLMKYLVWYNTEKPHRGIGKVPPLRYYVDSLANTKKSNMLWTVTKTCFICIVNVVVR
jgi:transposase InsO family protein